MTSESLPRRTTQRIRQITPPKLTRALNLQHLFLPKSTAIKPSPFLSTLRATNISKKREPHQDVHLESQK